MHVLDFCRVAVDESPDSLVPLVDGRKLTGLVLRYERSQRYRSRLGYSGVVPDPVVFGTPSAYYLGRARPQVPGPGRLWLLGCRCGIAMCWPLEATVGVTEKSVVWSEFRQPYRESWSYAGFGPFEFDRTQYEAVLRAIETAG